MQSQAQPQTQSTQQTVPPAMPIAPINPNEIAKQDASAGMILAITIFSVLSLNALTILIQVILATTNRQPPPSR